MDPIVGIGSNVCCTGACNRADHDGSCTGNIYCPKLDFAISCSIKCKGALSRDETSVGVFQCDRKLTRPGTSNTPTLASIIGRVRTA